MVFWHVAAAQKRWLRRFALLIGLLLVPVFVLAVFARPSADDYIYAARTHAVGKVSPEVQKLMDVTKQSFFEGIKQAKAGNHLHDISAAIQKYAESFGYGVVRELVGHGIGTHLHEDPQIPNFKTIGRGIRLRPGMTLAIEPMITMGDYAVSVLDDDWTVVTMDGSLSAHYENTILITEGAPEILTLPSYHME